MKTRAFAGLFFMLGLVSTASAQCSFQLLCSTNTGGTATPYNGMCVEDFDGNGTPDVAFSFWNLGAISAGGVMCLTNNGNFGFGVSSIIAVDERVTCLATADMNGDGKPDLFCAGYALRGYPDIEAVLTNGAGANFSYTWTVERLDAVATSATAGDLNGDGIPDIVSVESPGFSVMTNFNGGQLQSTPNGYGGSPQSVAFADLNDDGMPDLIVADNGVLATYLNIGGANFMPYWSNSITTAPGNIATIDLTGDGKVGVVVPDSGGSTLSIYTNDGTGNLALASAVDVATNPWCLAVADVNGDGKSDIIVGCNGTSAPLLLVLTNNGFGGFVKAATLLTNASLQSVAAADFDNDGKLDIVAAVGGTAMVFQNTSVFPSAGSQPKLSVTSTNIGVVVSWPSASPGWSLQYSRTLARGSWYPAGYSGFPISDDGYTKSLRYIPTGSSAFFRLRHP